MITKTHQIPAPERTEVLLVPQLMDRRGKALPARYATTHRYSHTEERSEPIVAAISTTPVGERIPQDVSYAHIFVCTETGAERVYGVEGPPSPHDEVDDEGGAA